MGSERLEKGARCYLTGLAALDDIGANHAAAPQQWRSTLRGPFANFDGFHECNGRRDDQPQQSESVVQPHAEGHGGRSAISGDWASAGLGKAELAPTSPTASEKTVAWAPKNLAAGAI